MTSSENFSCTSPLISQEIEVQLTEVFKKLNDDIVLVSIIDADNEKCSELAIFLNHIASLCTHISCKFYTLAEYQADSSSKDEYIKDMPLSCTMLPVVGIFKGKEFCRVAFHGTPGGKEINSFVMAILNASGCAKPLSAELLNSLQKYTVKTEILVCVSLQCPHCASVVIESQRLALLNENICANMVDANLFPELVSEYDIKRVPMTIINKKHVLVGEQTAEQILHYLNSMD